MDVAIESNPRRTPYVNRLECGEERFAEQIANARGLCHESDLPSNEGFRHHLGQLFYFRFIALAATETKICRKGLFGVPPELRDDMAICGLELQRREGRRCKSIATDNPGCFLKDSGRRKSKPPPKAAGQEV